MAAARTIIVSVAAVALLTPVGWVRTQPVYELRVGIPTRLGPRAAEHEMLTRSNGRTSTGRLESRRFVASTGDRTALPPGLAVDPATGALTGRPTLAGTYTVGVALSDGATSAIAGPLFKVRVQPAL